MQKIRNLLKILSLACIVTLVIFQIKKKDFSKVERKSTDEKTLLHFLSKNNLFLVDIDKLIEIKTYINSTWIQMSFDHFIDKLNIVSFGIMNEGIDHLLLNVNTFKLIFK